MSDPIAKEAFPLTKATGARGGGELNIKNNTSLWAALCFNTVGALCVSCIIENQQSMYTYPGLLFFFLLIFDGIRFTRTNRLGVDVSVDVSGDLIILQRMYQYTLSCRYEGA